MTNTEAAPTLPLHTVLQAQDIAVRFPYSANAAVKDADLQIVHGKVTALVGESGSGKSVTARAVMGLLEPQVQVRGSAWLSGRKDEANLQLIGAGRKVLNQVRGARIGMVFQDPTSAMNPLMTIGSQIEELLQIHQDLPRAQMKEITLALLDEVALENPERIYRAYPHQVSGGQLQRACIAMAIACKPCVLIADEPTTALDMLAQQQILELIRRLTRELNIGVLLITHDMGVVADLADTVTVLRNGEVVEAGEVEQIFYQPRETYTKNLLASVPRLGAKLQAPPAGDEVSAQQARDAVKLLLSAARESSPEQAADEGGATPAVSVENLTVVYPSGTRAVDDVSFSIPRGQISALVGQSGSGKSTISAAIYGQVKATAGTVKLGGVEATKLRGSAKRRALSNLGVVFQNPSASLNPRRTVIETVAEPLRTHTNLDSAARRERALAALTAARLEPSLAQRYPHELSGGQKQRVAIARAIVMRPQLVIADEPTSALDVSVQAQVLKTFKELQAEMGFAVLLITHDLAVVEQLATEVFVLKDGSLVESGPVQQVLQNPRTEYTCSLIEAVPVADPREQAQRRLQRKSELLRCDR